MPKRLTKDDATASEVYAKFIAEPAILGPYDFMDIYEAQDLETAHKVSLISRSEGALSAESWPALPYDGFLKVLESVHP